MEDFTVAWDYRCPFARNLTEHVLAGTMTGARWTAHFQAFSLDQANRSDGQADVWDSPPAPGSTKLAMQVGIAVRDHWPESFRSVHPALFAARHEKDQDLADEGVLRAVLTEQGLDADAVMAEATGGAAQTYRREHEQLVADHHVFGVPTIVYGEHAAFARLTERGNWDVEMSRRIIDRLLALVGGFPELNELKHTTGPGTRR